MLVLALTLPVATMKIAAQAGRAGNGVPSRPQGPCDIYAAGGSPCVAAHSSTRALSAAYNGPLYQVLRQSDGKTLDIGVVPPPRRTRADMPTRPRRTPSAPTLIAGSPPFTTSRATACGAGASEEMRTV